MLRNLIVCFLVVIGMQCATCAQDFRVESQVFVGESNDPVLENLTLYSGYMAYDFQFPSNGNRTPVEIVIYDSKKRELVLLDVSKKRRTDIKDFELLKMLEGLRSTGELNEDAQPLINPVFENQYDRDSGWVTLSNEHMTYKARGESPGDLNGMPLFYDAMNQFTRLSASDPKRLPPFARLALNREIKRHGFFPTEIAVMMEQGVAFKSRFQARSTHSVVWELSDGDKDRIAEAKNYWMQFEKVSIASYRGLSGSQHTQTNE